MTRLYKGGERTINHHFAPYLLHVALSSASGPANFWTTTRGSWCGNPLLPIQGISLSIGSLHLTKSKIFWFYKQWHALFMCTSNYQKSRLRLCPFDITCFPGTALIFNELISLLALSYPGVLVKQSASTCLTLFCLVSPYHWSTSAPPTIPHQIAKFSMNPSP